jgi:HPt (histidine-containing phosphotransfer) domain-containing protein
VLTVEAVENYRSVTGGVNNPTDLIVLGSDISAESAVLEDMDDRTLFDVVDPNILASFEELQEEGQPDIVAELLGLFLNDGTARVATLRSAISANDANLVHVAAHSLKGISGNLGMSRIIDLSIKLDNMGKAGDLSNADTIFSELDKEFACAKRLIEAELDRRSGNNQE